MINVRRYNLNIDKQNVYNDDMQLIGVSVSGAAVEEDPRGEYVKFEDYAVLELKLCLAKQAYDRLHQVHLAAMEMWRQETESQ